MQQDTFSLEASIIAITIILLILGAFTVIITLAYRKRRNRHIAEKISLEFAFKQELLKTQIEVQEQTLSNVGRELHDNITQVLSFVKLNLARLGKTLNYIEQQKIEENRELIARAINDLRHLSKSLSFEHIMHQGLIKALEAETDRINASELIKINLKINGDSFSLGEQRELILFRIFQEALNNALKHSGANRLNISLRYSEELFNLTLEDNGAGFSPDELADNAGSGLKNMRNRAAMMGAEATIYSSPGKGCSITISLNPKTKQLYADGTPPNSIG